MKLVILLVVLGGGIFLYLYFTGSTIKEDFDPTQQGKQARAAIKEGASWTEVIDVAGEPRKWKEGDSAFEFVTGYDSFDSKTGDQIRQQLEKGELRLGFCFLYRFSDAATFAVNFDKNGQVMNLQDKESKSDLLDSMGGG